jgi:hypothetical protein
VTSFQLPYVLDAESILSMSMAETRQVGSLAGRQAGTIDVPALTDSIFAAANNRTNIHSKTGST